MTGATGMTIRQGLGYSPVCLRCPTPQRLRVIVAYRSDAVRLLDEHTRQAHR